MKSMPLIDRVAANESEIKHCAIIVVKAGLTDAKAERIARYSWPLPIGATTCASATASNTTSLRKRNNEPLEWRYKQ